MKELFLVWNYEFRRSFYFFLFWGAFLALIHLGSSWDVDISTDPSSEVLRFFLSFVLTLMVMASLFTSLLAFHVSGRDQDMRTQELIFSLPLCQERFVLFRFLFVLKAIGVFLFVFTLLALLTTVWRLGHLYAPWLTDLSFWGLLFQLLALSFFSQVLLAVGFFSWGLFWRSRFLATAASVVYTLWSVLWYFLYFFRDAYSSSIQEGAVFSWRFMTLAYTSFLTWIFPTGSSFVNSSSQLPLEQQNSQDFYALLLQLPFPYMKVILSLCVAFLVIILLLLRHRRSDLL